MADAITGLTAAWVPNKGIQLEWTAADDATTESSYIVYVLTNTNKTVPTWSPIGNLQANVTRTISQTFYSLSAPLTSFFFKFPTNPLGSYAFRIVHIDSTGAQSPSTTVSVYQQQIFPPFTPPHLQNQIAIDSYGQFLTNAQDTYEDVSSNVAMLLGTIIGQRPQVSQYGIEDLPLTQVNSLAVQGSINKWEPRANASVTVKYDNNNNATLNVKIDNI